MEHLLLVQGSEVLVVPMWAYNLVLGLPWFQSRNPDINWQLGRLLALRIPWAAELLAVDRVDHQECPGIVPGSRAKLEACPEGGGSIPDIQMLRATAFDDLLASEEVIGTFFLRVGDCTGLLGATLEGITEVEWDWPQVLDAWAGSSGGSCGRRVSTQEPRITATGTPRHTGSTGWWGLGLPLVNCFKYRLLDIPPYCCLYIYITNSELMFADGASITTMMVSTDDGGHNLAIYEDFLEVFSNGNAETLPPHRSTDHAIDLEPSYNLPYGQIYNLLEFKLRTLKAYIEANLAHGFFQQSSSQILFAQKNNAGLSLCVDYHALNKVRVNNPYPLPLFSEMLDRVCEGWIFTKLDLCGGYYFIQINEGVEYKTDFWMCYGQFEYQVMPSGLTNPPATFQSYIDECLRWYIDEFAVCYLDDILIYSTNDQEHKQHMRQVLQGLKEFGPYCNTEKCQFGVSEVGFPGYVFTTDGVGMDSVWFATIEDWPTPKSVRKVQVLLGFTNFYQWFIWKYAKVNLPLKAITKEISNITLQEIRRLGQMGMDTGSRVGFWKTKKNIHWSTDPPSFWSGQCDYSRNGRERICDCAHSHSVWCCRGSQASQLLLPKVISSRTELWHLWSGAIGHCRNTKTVAALPRGGQLQDRN